MNDLLKLLYERQDGLFIAVKTLLTYESEGSSVNYRARTALREIAALGDDNVRLIGEAKLEHIAERHASGPRDDGKKEGE